jgi:hypothetical protein
MANRWNSLRRLPASERRLLLEAGLLLPALAVALRALGFQRVFSALARLAPAGTPPDRSGSPSLLSDARATARMVRIAAAHGPVTGNCLKRSLALWWLLRRQGIASDLRLGVRRETDGIDAHAWVECAGYVLNDSDDVRDRYSVFDRPIQPGGIGLT